MDGGADELLPGRDYELDAQGRWIFTNRYLTRRGFCCFLSCRHCPYGQAGRSQTQAQADLSQRLHRLAERLRAHGLPPLRLAYRNGVLHVSPIDSTAPGTPTAAPPGEGAPGLAGEEPALPACVLALARAELTVQRVQWD